MVVVRWRLIDVIQFLAGVMGLHRISSNLISFIQHQEKYGIAHAIFPCKNRRPHLRLVGQLNWCRVPQILALVRISK